MRNYQVYLIDDEFASHYFGRESMFYKLFKDYDRSFGDMKVILSKQINFITKPIPTLRIHQTIHQHLQKKRGFRTNRGKYYYEIGKNSCANLAVHDRYIEIQASGSYESETVFFEVLRKNEHSFLAIDLNNDRYGWLKPIKERKFV